MIKLYFPIWPDNHPYLHQIHQTLPHFPSPIFVIAFISPHYFRPLQAILSTYWFTHHYFIPHFLRLLWSIFLAITPTISDLLPLLKPILHYLLQFKIHRIRSFLPSPTFLPLFSNLLHWFVSFSLHFLPHFVHLLFKPHFFILPLLLLFFLPNQ